MTNLGLMSYEMQVTISERPECIWTPKRAS
jgi:hypothetical protein